MSETANISQHQNNRIVIIDTLRGFALVYMIFFHIIYDLAFLIESEWGINAYEFNVQFVIFDISSFITLAGISSAFSHSNSKRGGRLLAIGIVFTFVSAFVFPGQGIYFGILQLFGFSMVLYGAFEEKLKKLPALPMIIACAVMFAITFNVQFGFFGIKGLFKIEIPAELTLNNNLYPYGIFGRGYSSVDYEPMLPWFFLYFGSTYIGGLILKYRDKLPKFCYADPLPPISLMGRHSLMIYVLHQPVILPIIYGLKFIIEFFG